MHRDLNVLRPSGDAGELAQPLRPEQERGGGAERQDDDEDDLPGFRERHERGPLGDEHAERRDEHHHDAEHHEARQARHALEQKVHVLDVAAADVVLGRAHAQEQKRLRDGVEQHEERRRPDGLGGAHARAGRDEAEVGDGGVREHALGVALADGHERAEQERESAHEDDHDGRDDAHHQNRRQLDEQEHAGLDHGGRVKERACGRGRHHGAEQPRVEGHLSGFGKARKRESGHRQRHQSGVFHADAQKLQEGKRLELHRHDEERRQKRDAAGEVHDDLAEGVAHGLLGAGEPDEEERAHRGDLPAREQPHHVVGEHDEKHRGEEHEHEGKKRRAAVLGALRLVLLEVLHVAQGVHADAAAHHADDERHEQRERVEVERLGHGHAVGEPELEDEGADELDGRQHARPNVLVADAIVQDGRRHKHAHRKADVVDHRRVELEGHIARSQVRRNQPYGNQGYDRSRTAGQYFAHPLRSRKEHRDRHCKRKRDEKQKHFHKASLLLPNASARPLRRSAKRACLIGADSSALGVRNRKRGEGLVLVTKNSPLCDGFSQCRPSVPCAIGEPAPRYCAAAPASRACAAISAKNASP